MQSPTCLEGFDRGAAEPAAGRTLVLIIHGWKTLPADLRDVCAATREALADAAGVDLYVPALPYVRFFSFDSPAEVTARLLADLDRLCTDPYRYARIFLVGHSIGAVIARRLFLVATGMNDVVPSEGALQAEQARPWAARICRIVAFAALSRGWIRSGRLGWLESAAALAFAVAGHGSPGTRKPTLFEVRRGAPFIVQTRLQWLALQRDPAKPKPLIIHLLGTQDNLVAPDDAVDFAVDGRN
jgi:pimeloyl-ACP methyl ester carboxylesterase